MQWAHDDLVVEEAVGEGVAAVGAGGAEGPQGPVGQPEDGNLFGALGEGNVVDLNFRADLRQWGEGSAVRNCPGVTGCSRSAHGST